MHGLGPVAAQAQRDEPVFHHAWQRRAFAITLACGALGHWNLDESRHARERQHPVDYLRNDYYENWLAGLTTLLREKGLLSEAELAGARASGPAGQAPLAAGRVAAVLRRGAPVDLPPSAPPVFAVGDAVRVINAHPRGHTRVPRYARGHRGVIVAHRGCHVFADAHAHGERRGEHLYTVRMPASALWGNDSHDSVHVDLWQPHLVAA